MSAPTPSLREQGVQALHEGNLDKAIDLLARAVMADDKDAEAKALLGITYSQKGLHTQAKRALQTAVELHPNNANYRFNLGVVLERAGDMPGAAAAYRDTLAINKDHAQARTKLQAIPNAHQLLANAPPSSPSGPGAPPPPGAGMPPPGGAPPAYNTPPAYGAPPGQPGQFGQAPPPPAGYGAPPGAPPSYGPAPMGSPPPMPQVGGPPLGGPPPGAPPMGMPPMPGAPPMPGVPMGGPPMGGGLNAPQGPPGTVQCARCGQFSRPGLTCEWCSAPMAPPPARPTQTPGAMVGGPAPAPYSYSAAPNTSDMTKSEAFFRRFGATMIDGMLLGAIGFVVGLVMGGTAAVTTGGGSADSPAALAAQAGANLALLVVQFLYYGFMYSTRGQTLGKMALGIRVVTADGSNPGFWRGGFRDTFGHMISGCLCGLGYLSMLWDNEQQTWHDKLFGTYVVRA